MGLVPGSTLNVVDVTLIVFFAVFGVTLVLACAYVTCESMQKRGGARAGRTAANSMTRPVVSYEED